jgi:hypothetical protein
MAYPLVPPPAGDVGALTWPRQLQRWLDDNPVGPLTRISTYIVLPAFTQASNTWNGYSDIVEAFNFEGPNHLSLKVFVAPIAPNYSLCISYQVQGVVTRYSLWRAVGDNIPGPVIPYVNQYIDPNFRLEIWNTSQGVASQSSSFTFYTGKLGGIDYRWGTDTTLVGSDVPVTNFENINSIALLTATLSGRWRPQDMVFNGVSGGAMSAWNNEVAGPNLSPTGTSNVFVTNVTLAPNTPQAVVVTTGYIGNIAYANPAGCVAVLFFVKTLPVSGTTNIYYNGNVLGLDLSINSTGYLVSFNANLSNVALSLNTWYLVILGVSYGIAYLYNPVTCTQIDSWISGFGSGNDSVIEIGGPNIGVSEVSIFSTDIIASQLNNLVAYFGITYFNQFSLPLIFPANSISVTN